MKNIKITGYDIIGYDGEDHTRALKELGVNYKYNKYILDRSITSKQFFVDLDFVLRHGLLNDTIYKEHYKGTNEYNKYYYEGKRAFLEGKDEEPSYPYSIEGNFCYSPYHKRIPWYDGYRETRKDFYEKKYNFIKIKKSIKEIVENAGCNIEYEDEYGYPYIKTPEGYTINLA